MENKSYLTAELEQKLNNIKSYFFDKTIVVAFSGGVDSSVVMEMAHLYGKRAVAVTADSVTILPGEVEYSIELAMNRGYEHRIIEVNELADDNFASNPINRCYYCKSDLVEILNSVAIEIGADIIVEGTNISETGGHRPGLQAIQEADVKSPLLEFKLTKSDIRLLARYFDLPNAEKPSLACLSSRFPTGVKITKEKLIRLGKAERYILDTYRIRTLRVRDHEGLARIEVSPEEREKLLDIKILDDLSQKLKSFGFNFVTIDCTGYKTGSLSEVALQTERKSTEQDIQLL
jgi:uncharacterized protein